MAGPHVEEWIRAADNTLIYTKTWKSAKEPPIATVVFVHGFGEHINRYDHVFDKFSAVGIETYSYDQRGFGRTAEKNNCNWGVTGGWGVLTSDITAALVAKRRNGIPQFLYGQSMGGGLVLDYACNGPERGNLAGYLASSPLVELAPENQPPLPFITLLFCKIAAALFPNRVIKRPLDACWMSHDKGEVEKYEADPYIKPDGSFQCFNDMATRPQALLTKESYKNITLPVYIAHGTGDKATSHKASEKFFRKIPSSNTDRYHYRAWPKLFHELHNEIERNQVIQEYIDWFLARAKEQSQN